MLFGIGVGASGSLGHAQVERAIVWLTQSSRLLFLSRSDLVSGPGTDTRAGAWFCNAACIVDTALHPRDLLRHLHALERRAGRVRCGARVYATRTLDLDILWSTHRYRDAVLSVPHEKLDERTWARGPLEQARARYRALAHDDVSNWGV